MRKYLTAYRLRKKLEDLKLNAKAVTEVFGHSGDPFENLAFCSKISVMNLEEFRGFTLRAANSIAEITQSASEMPQWAQEELLESCPDLKCVAFMLNDAAEVENDIDLLEFKTKYIVAR